MSSRIVVVALTTSVIAAAQAPAFAVRGLDPSTRTVTDPGPSQGWTSNSHWVLNAGDHTVTRTVFPTPQFRQVGANWVPIDPTVRSTGSKLQPLAALGAMRPIRFGARADDLVSINLARGPITLRAIGLRSVTPTLLPAGAVRYAKVATSTDLVYTVDSSGVNEQLILSNAHAPTSFRFHLSDPRRQLGTPKQQADGSWVFAKNIADGHRLHLLAPSARSAGEQIAQPGSATMTVTPVGDGYDVVQSIDPTWLKGKSWPIVLDPSLSFTGSPTILDCEITGGTTNMTTNYCPNATASVGFTSGLPTVQTPHRYLLHFDMSSFPTHDAQITNASLNLYLSSITGTSSQTIEAHDVTSAWTSSVNWLTTDGTHLWTSAGGDFSSTVQASTTAGPAVNTVVSLANSTLSTLVSRWVATPSSNLGVIVKAANETIASVDTFASTEASQSGQRPVLVVTYSAPPDAPGAFTATRGDGSASLNWTTPSSNGSPITGYTVKTYKSDGTLVATNSVAATATSYTVTGLTNGTGYYFTIAATNAINSGPIATSATVTPAGVPFTPTGVSATAAPASATISWTPPNANGSALTGYTVTATRVSDNTVAATTSAAADARSATVTGLTNGTAYTLAVAAINAVGTGNFGAASAVTPADVPSAPGNLAAQRGDHAATVTWTAAADNGATLSANTVTTYNGDGSVFATTSLGGSAVSYTATGLTNGNSYYFTVSATNSVGAGAASTSNTVVPAGVPAAPATVSASRGDGQVSVSWSGAGGNGAAITGYTLTTTRVSDNTVVSTTSAAANASSATVTGLSNGVTYVVAVAARNDVGTGPATASGNVTPAGLPTAPSNVIAVRGDGQASVTWTAASPNGSALTGQTVTVTGSDSSQRSFSIAAGLTSLTVTGLTNGVTYTVAITATNDVGTGAAGTSNGVVPAGVPFAPTTVTASRGDGQVGVSWSGATGNGSAITGYTITTTRVSDNSVVSTTSAAAGASSATITGLVNGTAYTVAVAARNDVGTGAATVSSQVTPAGLPTAPGNVTATRGDGQASVTWTAASPNGSAVTGQTVTVTGSDNSQRSFSIAADLTSLTVTGLTNGVTYTIAITATNDVGTSAAGTSNGVVPAGVPNAPANVTSQYGDTAATIGWDPAGANGDAVTGYQVQLFTSANVLVSTANLGATATSKTFTGLTNGQDYYATVTATNSVGASAAAQSPTVTPAGLPSAPASVSVVRGDGSITASWSAPSSNGHPITGYVVSWTLADGTPVGTTTVGGTTTTYTATGLANGTTYIVSVAAQTDVGTSAATTSAPATPAAAPAAATSFNALRGDHAIALTWVIGAANGDPITGQTLTWRLVSDGSQVGTASLPANAASYTITGLTNGVAYYATLTATNTVGVGAAATSNNATPAGLPTAPGNVSATRGDQSATVNWTAANGNGDAITGYSVAVYTADGTYQTSVSAGPSATSTTVSALTNGTSYYFVITATNAVGTSSGATTNTVTPAGVPILGTASATAIRYGATVSWPAANANGSALTGYVVRTYDASTNGQIGSDVNLGSSTTSTTVYNLAEHSSYYFTVTATNGIGNSTASQTSTLTIPFAGDITVNLNPAAVTTVAGNGTSTTTTGTGTGASFNNAWGVAVVGGYAYVYDTDAISKVQLSTGVTTILAGSPGSQSCSDGANPRFSGTSDMATDGAYAYTISTVCGLRRTSLATGLTTTLLPAGTLTVGCCTHASGVAVGADGDLYITFNNALWRYVPSTAAFTSLYTFPAGSYTNSPGDAFGVAADSNWIYASVWRTDWTDSSHCCTVTTRTIYRVSYDGTTTNTLTTDPALSGQMLESAGDYLYGSTTYGAVRRYTKSDGTWRDVAGAGTQGYADGVGSDAWFNNGVHDLSADGTNLYLMDGGFRLRKLAAASPLLSSQQATANTTTAISTGAVSTVAGSGSSTTTAGTGTSASFNNPYNVVVANGYAYVSDSDAISKVALATGVTTILVGTPGSPSCSDASTGASAREQGPNGLTTDGYYLYSADGTCGLRRISIATGATQTLVSAGALGVNCCSGAPNSITFGADGNLYFSYKNQIWRYALASGLYTSIYTFPAGSYTNSPGDAYGLTSDSNGLYVAVARTDWTNSAHCCTVTTDTIYRLSYDAATVTTVTTDPALNTRFITSAGDYLYGSTIYGAVRRYTKSDGTWRDVAGAGTQGYADGVGSDAWFNNGVHDIAVDGTNLYVVDGGFRLRKVSSSTALPSSQQSTANTTTAISTGAVSTVAGSGTSTTSAGAGTSAGFNNPYNVVVVNGYAYVSDSDAISKVELATGVTTIFVGAPGSPSCSDASTGSAAREQGPNGMTTDGHYLYSADGTCGLRRISIATGATQTLVSAGALGVNCCSGAPNSITFGADGNLYFNYRNQVWRYVLATGLYTSIYTFPAGSYTNSPGDAYGLTSDSNGLYVAVARTDWTSPAHCCTVTTNTIYRVSYDGATVTTMTTDPALNTRFITSAGDYLYGSTIYGAVRRYTKSDGTWRDVAGAGTQGYADGVGTDAWFNNGVHSVAVDGTNLYVVDGGFRLRKVSPATALPSSQPTAANTATSIAAGVVSTIAGSGTSTTAAGTGTSASFNNARGVVVVGGFAYVADQDAISKVQLSTGVTTILAGQPGSSSCGDASSGASARFYGVNDIATDGYYAYTADSTCGLRRISLATGATETLVTAGTLSPGCCNGGANGITIGADDNLYFTLHNGVWRYVLATGLYTNLYTFPAGSYSNSPGDAFGITSDSNWLYVSVQRTDWTNQFHCCTITANNIYRLSYNVSTVSVLAGDSNMIQGPIESAGGYIYSRAYYSNGNGRVIVSYSKTNGAGRRIAGASTTGTTDGLAGAATFTNIADLAGDGTNLYTVDGNKLRVISQSKFYADGSAAFGDDPNADFQQDVNPGLGSFVTSATDASVASVGPALGVSRTYNSADPNDVGMGVGWSDNLQMHWATDVDGDITIQYPDGRRETQSKTVVNGNTVYVPPPGYSANLVSDGSGGWVLTESDGTVYRLAANGTLTSVTDNAGLTESYTYNADGTLAQMLSASGRHLNVTWTAGHITSIATDPVNGAPLTWTYTYTGNLLTKVCDPRGTGVDHCTTYDYTSGLLTRIIKPRGTTSATVGYNPDGTVQFREDGLGDFTFFTDPNSAQPTITDPSGHDTTQTVDGSDRLTSETDTAGGTTTYGYDSNGFRNTTTDANNHTTSAVFDAHGNETSITDSNGHTAHQTFDANNDVLSNCDERSASLTDTTYCTTYTYDSHRNKLSETKPPTPGFPNGATRTWTYATGTEAAVGGGTVPVGVTLTSSDFRGNVTTYKYDSAGDLVETDAPNGLRTVDAYDALGRKTSETLYSDTFPSGVTTAWTYDGLGSVLTETGPAVTNSITGVTHQQQTTNIYDGNENLTSTTVSDLTGGDTSRTTSYVYDSLDRQVSSIDAQTGQALHRTFDANGNVATVTDQLGRETVTTYDAANRPIHVTQLGVVTDPIGGSAPRDIVTKTMGYDAAGQLTSETDALGRTTTYTYDNSGRQLTTTLTGYHNRDGSTRSIVLDSKVYDAAGNMVDEYTGGGQRHVHNAYDAAGRVSSSVLDPGGLNRTTNYTYDADDHVLTQTLTDGTRSETTSYTYDVNGDKLTESVSTGSQTLTTSYTYDERGIVTSQTDPRGNLTGADPSAYTTTTTTDELGRTVAVTGAPVSVESNGDQPTTARPVTRSGYDTFGDATQSEDADGNITTTDYDKIGRRTVVHYPAYTTPGGTTLHPTESWTYDNVGNQLSHTDRRGQTSTYVFDSMNRVVAAYDPLLAGQSTPGVTRTTYDDDGNKLTVTNEDGAVTESTYDDLNRVRTQTQDVRQPDSSVVRDTTTFDYDDQGDQTYVQDPTGNVSGATFDAAGEQLTSTDAANNTTTNTYDVAGRQTGSADPLGRTWMKTYDLAGRLLTFNHYDHNGTLLTTVSYGYDAAGNQTSTTSANGNTTTNAYDAANRLTSVTQPVAAGVTITTTAGYDAAGNMTRMTDGNGNTTIRTYTSWNTLASTIEPATTAEPNAADRTWTTTYDAGGLAVTAAEPGGVTVSKTYDNLGRLTSESASGGDTSAATHAFGYDLAGRRTSLSTPTGNDTYTYDDRGLPLTASGPSGSATFTYNANGLPTQRTDAAGTVAVTYNSRNLPATIHDTLSQATRTYTYNGDGQPTNVAISGSGGATSTRTLGYDDLGRWTTDQLANASGTVTASYAYSYDADNNIVSQTVNLPNNPADGTHTYAYDQADRLTSWTTPGDVTTTYGWDNASNRTQAGSATYTYDQRNELASGPQGSYAWDAEGNLTSITAGSGVVTSYTYDGFNRVASATSGGQTAAYSYDSLDRLISSNGAGLSYAGFSIKPAADGTQLYARGTENGLLAVTDGSTTSLAGVEQHHDLTYLAQADGSVGANQFFDPFGAVAGAFGSMNVALGFQSDVTDATTGDVWMGARWYAPGDDTFISQDTVTGELGQPQSLNLYTYAAGDPTTYFDADGHSYVGDDGGTAAPSSSGKKSSGSGKSKSTAKWKPHFERTLKYVRSAMMHGQDVKFIQQCLNVLGSHLATDGWFGSGTQSAVEHFQSRTSLTVNGVVTKFVFNLIMSLADRWKYLQSHPSKEETTQWVVTVPTDVHTIESRFAHTYLPRMTKWVESRSEDDKDMSYDAGMLMFFNVETEIAYDGDDVDNGGRYQSKYQMYVAKLGFELAKHAVDWTKELEKATDVKDVIKFAYNNYKVPGDVMQAVNIAKAAQ